MAVKMKLTERVVAGLARPAGEAQAYFWDTQLAGFGLCVGARLRTFVAKRRVGGRKRKVKIGVLGHPREDGLPWTVALARRRAAEVLGQMAAGVDPSAEARARRGGVTLRQGLELHAGDMAKRGCSPRSVETLRSEVPRLMGEWLDRPLVDLTALDLHEIHERLSPTPFLANRIVAEVSAIWNSVDRLHELPGRNPASRVRRNKLPAKHTRVEDLAAWYAAVQAIRNPVRRDLQLFVLFTGLRSADARSIRWEDLDEVRGALRRPSPKGGVSKAFVLPLTRTTLDILDRRRRENAAISSLGDGGWVFPSMSRDGKRVIHVVEPKERRGRAGERASILPGLHDLRRTYASAAAEIGIPEIDRRVLLNHSFSDKSVSDGYVSQSFEHLRDCAAKVEEALWRKIRAPIASVMGPLHSIALKAR